mmetsp:Transcript_24238/g.56032  ORF Transcript_24238/g.56032 Transcript_24238/m.56032 type:complete len:103 (-) Transcript_24238:23-331(-)
MDAHPAAAAVQEQARNALLSITGGADAQGDACVQAAVDAGALASQAKLRSMPWLQLMVYMREHAEAGAVHAELALRVVAERTQGRDDGYAAFAAGVVLQMLL